MSRFPRCRHRAAIPSMGRIKPNTLDTWVHTTSVTSGVISRENSPSMAPWSKGGAAATFTVTPGMAWRGRVTALCS